jgi:hypothetical protein
MEGSLVAYIVFTNGSTLQASELNENLMQQSTAVFSNAAARTAAITSPLEGQLTYLEDVDRYDHWNGSAWVSPFGMTLVGNVSFTTSSAVAVDNVFTSSYRNYLVLVNVSGTTAVNHTLNLRVGGATNSTLNYTYGSMTVVYGNNAVNGAQAANASSWAEGGRTTAGDRGATQYMIYSPQLAEKTFYQFATTDAQITRSGGGIMNATTAFDGFIVTPSGGTITGNIRVYGVRN